MSDNNTENNHSQGAPKSGFLSTPVAILISGVLITLAVLYSQGDLPFLSGKGKINPEPTDTTKAATQEEKLALIAGDAGVDVDKFNSCLANNDTVEIQGDSADAQAVGIGGTPGFVIGKRVNDNQVEGVRVSGAYPYTSFSSIINAFESGDNKKVLEAANELAKLGGSEEFASYEEAIVKVSLDDDPKQGNNDAKIAIVEFSDYECPFCQRHFQQTYPQLKTNYIDTGKTLFVFRDLPLPFHDPIATQAAVAANCVREQGGDEAYFKFHDQYFTNTLTNAKGLK